jgi:hypothetical protein
LPLKYKDKLSSPNRREIIRLRAGSCLDKIGIIKFKCALAILKLFEDYPFANFEIEGVPAARRNLSIPEMRFPGTTYFAASRPRDAAHISDHLLRYGCVS